MATVFVNSGAAGLNNGTSWTDAYTSIASTTGAGTAAGDEVRVHNAHTQTGTTGTLNWSNGTVANPVKIFCVDKNNSDALSTGAAVNCNSGGVTLQGNIAVDGVTFTQSATTFSLTTGSEGVQQYRNCTFTLTGSGQLQLLSARGLIVLENTTIDLTGTSSAAANLFFFANAATIRMYGGMIKTKTAGTTTLIDPGDGGTGALFVGEGVAITGTCTNLTSVSSGTACVLRHCTLPTYTNLVLATPTAPDAQSYLLVEGCSSGTITVPPLGLTALVTRYGTIQSDLTRYRTGGADDGTQANPHSWATVSNANALAQFQCLRSPPVVRWVAAGSYTITVYVAGGATLTNADFWLDVESPSEAGSATAQVRYQNTRNPDRGTAANLTTDASTWNGSGVGTVQKVTMSIAPTVAGPVSVHFCLGKASTTLYVDPKYDVA